MKKNLNNIIKQIKTNKDILRTSLRTSVSALLKTLLLHRLQKMRFFKPITIVIRVLLKWSAYTSIFSLFYSAISSIFNLDFDLTFWFAIIYALWLVLSEGLLDYIIDSYEFIISKIYHKLESNPTTIKQADKLQDRHNVLTVEELRERNRRSRKDIDVNTEMDYERRRKNSIIGKSTPDYNNPNNYNTDYWTYAYYAVTAIGAILGAYLIYALFTGDTTVLYYCWDKIKEGYYYLSSCIPDSIKNYLWRKLWPFDRDPDSPRLPTGDEDETVTVTDDTDPKLLSLKDMKKYIEQHLGIKRYKGNIGIHSHYRNVMTREGYEDPNDLKSLVEYYLTESQKAAEGNKAFGADETLRTWFRPGDVSFAEQSADTARRRTLNDALLNRVLNPEGEALITPPTDPEGGGGGAESEVVAPTEPTGEVTPTPDVTPRPKTVDLPETTGDSSSDSKGKGRATPEQIQHDPRVKDFINRLSHVYDPNCSCKDCLFTNKNPKTILIREFMNQIPPQIVDFKLDGDVLDIITQSPDHVINCRCPLCRTNEEKFNFIRKFFNVVDTHPSSPEDRIYNTYLNSDLSNIKLEPIAEEPEDAPKQPKGGSGSKKSHSLPPLLLTNKFNSNNNNRSYSTKAPSDHPEGNESITKVYHIKDVNNYIITVLLKFFDSINLDGAWGVYPSNTVRDIAKDKCIELSIKLQNFQVDKNDTEDYGLPLITLVHKAPIDLTDKKIIFGFIFFMIHRVIALTEINKNLFSDKGLNVIVEYKYISVDDYTNKLELFNDQVLNENFPFGPINK